MYKIIHISSGIVAATFNDLSFAKDWLFENNTLSGEPANLYKIVKAIQKNQEHNAPELTLNTYGRLGEIISKGAKKGVGKSIFRSL